MRRAPDTIRGDVLAEGDDEEKVGRVSATSRGTYRVIIYVYSVLP